MQKEKKNSFRIAFRRNYKKRSVEKHLGLKQRTSYQNNKRKRKKIMRLGEERTYIYLKGITIF